jgi:NADH-quinone oxidoreductase subunit G
MATVQVNGKSVDIGAEKVNLIQAALKAGVFIPHYCWHPALTVVASCRMCLVEVGERKPDGSVAMQPKVVPACQTPAKDGTVIITNSPRAIHAQQQTLESLLINHPLDCPVCDKAGECLLQDFSYSYGRSQSRMVDDKNQPPNKPHIGEKITLFADRCIMCSRCVRFTREVSGTAELQVINRGDHSEIDIFPGEPCNNKLAGNVVDLCPVGALCSKDFLYKQRVWYLKTQETVCADCSTGCSIFLDHNKDIIYRLRPRENPQAQGHFMCDEGRFGYRYVNAEERLGSPLHRQNGRLVAAPWPEILSELRRDLAAVDSSRLAGIFSPFLTCEEAFLFASFLKKVGNQAKLALGPVPVIGSDDTFPKDRKGKAIQPVKFTIRAEKCPNRRGVEEVLRHFQGEVIPFERILEAVDRGEIQAAYLASIFPGRQGGWISASQAKRFQKVPLIVVQDLFASPISMAATYVLPGASFAEKSGTFVNHRGLAQAIRWAIRPPRECRNDGQIFLDLLQLPGLVHADSLRQELARCVPYFAPLLEKEIGSLGISLEPAARTTA